MLLAMERAYGKSINEAIEEICQKKDREGLENWRSFYTTYLLPLDKEAQNLMQGIIFHEISIRGYLEA